MRYRWLWTVGILGAILGTAFADEAAPAEPAAAPVPVVTLLEAARDGKVEASGFQPASYRRVHLQVRNRTRAPLEVDLCASSLRPKRRGSCQRLGIGPPVTPGRTRRHGPGTVVLHLDPGETTTLELNTCCLDSGRASPGRQDFVVARIPLPPVRETVLRWWADNPTAPQSAVNAAIWQFRDTVHVGPGVVETYREPHGRSAAAHGGTYYRLRDGELVSLDADGIERFLGTEIFQVIPVEGAVYAVALGEDRCPDLWRLALTGDEPWGFVMDLGITDRVRDVIPAEDGNLVLVTDRGICYWDHSGRTLSTSLTTRQILHLSTRFVGRGRLTATVRRPPTGPLYRSGERFGEKAPVFEVWSIDLATGRAERVKEYWNVKGMLAGPAGVFGLSHRGRLRRLVRTSFRDFDGDESYERILAVGRKTVWIVTADGRLAAASAATGRRLHTFDLAPSEFSDFDLDVRTDDLAYVREGAWYRIRAASGDVEEVRSPH